MNFTVIPKKRFSQNFLVNKNLVLKLARHIISRSNDTILEIGPGTGALTVALLQGNKRVIGVEIDMEAVEYLDASLKTYSGFKLISGNFLDYDIKSCLRYGNKLSVAGNLPYGLTGPIIMHLIKNFIYIKNAFIMVQKEVGKRINAEADSSNFSFLSAAIQSCCRIKPVMNVKAGSFRPIPQVDSMFLQLDFFPNPKLKTGEIKEYLCFLTAAFSHRRKFVIKNLAVMYDLDKLTRAFNCQKIRLNARAQEIESLEYLNLFRILTYEI
ncbi:MAG: 16S rRNA (adenine(1518)-N(6)/adenine(1519)-N(6))-dimethyltransferase RsmA [bacterium]